MPKIEENMKYACSVLRWTLFAMYFSQQARIHLISEYFKGVWCEANKAQQTSTLRHVDKRSLLKVMFRLLCFQFLFLPGNRKQRWQWGLPGDVFPGGDGSDTHTSAYWRRWSPGVPGSGRRTCRSVLRRRSREDSPCWCRTCSWLQKHRCPGIFSPPGPRCNRTGPCRWKQHARWRQKKHFLRESVAFLRVRNADDFNFRWSIEDQGFCSISEESRAKANRPIDYRTHIHVYVKGYTQLTRERKQEVRLPVKYFKNKMQTL